MDPLSFRCSCGAAAERPTDTVHGCTTGFGERCAEWHETRETALATGLGFSRRHVAPLVGETCWLRLSFPFAGSVGDNVTILFEPCMIAINGIDGSSEEEIRSIALITGLVEEAHRRDETSAVARLTVHSQLTVTDLLARPRVKEWAGMAAEHFALRDRYCETIGSFRWYQASIEGDAGCWALGHEGPDGSDILLYGLWDNHYDHVVAGRWAAPDFLQPGRFAVS